MHATCFYLFFINLENSFIKKSFASWSLGTKRLLSFRFIIINSKADSRAVLFYYYLNTNIALINIFEWVFICKFVVLL